MVTLSDTENELKALLILSYGTIIEDNVDSIIKEILPRIAARKFIKTERLLNEIIEEISKL